MDSATPKTRPATPQSPLHEGVALRALLEGTATKTGRQFFYALVENLAAALDTYGAWVTEYLEDSRRLRALAFWMNGEWVEGYEHSIDGTPCEAVVTGSRLVHLPENVLALYPDDPDVKKISAVSYMGVPLLDVDGRVLGHLAVMDKCPMPPEPRVEALFRIFAARAAAELQRLRAESEVREREEKLSRLVDSAMDAIIELDGKLGVTRVNPAAEKMLECAGDAIRGLPFSEFLDADCSDKLSPLVTELARLPEDQRYLWIPGGITVRSKAGREIPAEATFSRYEMNRELYYTLILRNVNDRVEAERRIRSLVGETEYLRDEIRSLLNADEIVGESEALVQVLRDVEQVADTDTTVLILGETGTGKELVAQAIHTASRRSAAPLVRVNCAAVPAALMESEFFGHEKGAFTGATGKRDGRFALADGGSIFLDEVGELSTDMQAKLLRVLQEGEFEPVGGDVTRTVDVRVIAATNRNLFEAVKEGSFREDLYYRLNVFPIDIPPLRERREDIDLLADAFVRKFAGRTGRRIAPLTEECRRRLRAYDWPGNVRELQNVIELAVITARDGRLNLDRALPAQDGAPPLPETPEAGGQEILTEDEMRARERDNLLRALEAADWRVAGERGAARLLGMKPSTLSSRMKALGLVRPR